jgi:uncharacterized membrane protein HdeD (DUF308 family)
VEQPRPLLRALLVILGLLALVVGVVLFIHPVAAATSLAWLIALSLVISGALEISATWPGPQRWLGVLLGMLLVAGGVVAVSWPGITLWALAFVVGIDLLVHGLARVTFAIVDRAEFAGWGWAVFRGALNIVVGVAALAWPAATVLVLALLVGVQIVALGVLMLLSALVDDHEESPPAFAG